MTATVDLDENLLAQAREIAGKQEPSELLNEVLKVYIQLDSARKLAAAGGTMPELKPTPRRRLAR